MSATTIPAKVLRAAAEASNAKDAMAKMDKDRAILEERCQTLEARFAEMISSKEVIEKERIEACEAVKVAQAERRLVDETIARADSLVGELRAERAALLSRATDAEAEVKDLQKQVQVAEEARAALAETFAVEQVERRATDQAAERLTAQLEEAKQSTVHVKAELEERLRAAEAARDEERAERTRLQLALSVAQAERKMVDESAERAAAQAELDKKALQLQLVQAEGRTSGDSEAKVALEQEKHALQASVAVAQAEKRLLQDLTARMQQMQLDERQLLVAAKDRAESSAAELAVRLESAESALVSGRERIGVLEAERQALSERALHTDEQLKRLQGEHSMLTTERRQLEDTIRRQEAQVQSLQLERAATHSLEERFRDMQLQRDTAEGERSELQEELASTHAKHSGLEQATRSAESALKAAQHELEIEKGKERERDERIREFQRQRDTVQRERAKLQEQLSIATADARAASEREHALFIRTTVLEQQLSAATTKAIHGSVYDSGMTELVPTPISVPGDDGGPPPSIEAALESVGAINKRWEANSM